MANKKRQPLPYRHDKGKPVATRSGCKVSWKVYATRAEAEAAAIVAIHNAEIDESLGYDFGYCCPGSIAELSGERLGLYPELVGKPGTFYEVCFS